MAKGASRAARLGAALRRLFFAAALVSVGVCGGVVLGTVWDLPELLLRRLSEVPVTVELEPRQPEPLSAFAELQSARARRPVRPPVAAAPPAAKPKPKPKPEPRAESASAPTARDRAMADVALRQARIEGTLVVIQVASYTDRRSADALSNRLRRDGFDAYVSDTHPTGETRYRVRVRPGENDAGAVAGRLQASGFKTWVTSE